MRRVFTSTWLAAMAACMAGFAAPAATAAAPVYTIEPIPVVGKYIPESIAAINNAGWIVGNARTQSGARSVCFVYAEQTTRILPDSDSALCHGMNDEGDVVGVVDGQSYLWPHDGGPRQLIPGLRYAGAINSQGQIVGSARFDGVNDHAAFYSNGVLTDLGTLGGNTSFALAINAAGEVTGRASLATGAYRPFRWAPGTSMEDLGHISGWDSGADDINSDGHVLGYTVDLNGVPVCFIDKGDGQGMHVLPTINGLDMNCSAINDKDAVVGSAFTNETSFATLTVKGKTYRFSKLLDSSGAAWSALAASDINNAGHIAGSGKFEGEYRAYVATRVAP